MNKVKYIKTDDFKIIVFSELQQHKEFKHFNPVSAGFIVFGYTLIEGAPEVTCTCYGESESLGLKSDEVKDSRLARMQILGYNY